MTKTTRTPLTFAAIAAAVVDGMRPLSVQERVCMQRPRKQRIAGAHAALTRVGRARR